MPAIDAQGKPFNLGDLVVYPGHGLGKIVGSQEVAGKIFLMLELVDRGMRIGLPEELAATTLTRPIGSAEANVTLATLKRDDGEPDLRAWPYRARDGYRILDRGPQEARVRHLHTLYRDPFAPGFGERKMISAFEDAVLPELASALERDLESLRTELHAIHPVFKKDAPERPEEPEVQAPRPSPPFELPGFSYFGDFTVEAELVIGEPGSTLSHADQPPEVDVRHNVRLAVRPGHWLGFKREDDGAANSLVAVHEAASGRLLTLLHSARVLSRVIVEGGRIALLDASVRSEPEFVDEMEFPLFPEGLIKERGVACTTGRDGVFPVLAARTAEGVELVAVSFEADSA